MKGPVSFGKLRMERLHCPASLASASAAISTLTPIPPHATPLNSLRSLLNTAFCLFPNSLSSRPPGEPSPLHEPDCGDEPEGNGPRHSAQRSFRHHLPLQRALHSLLSRPRRFGRDGNGRDRGRARSTGRRRRFFSRVEWRRSAHAARFLPHSGVRPPPLIQRKDKNQRSND